MQPFDIWHKLGGIGAPPKQLGRFGGPLLLLGGARCVWSDLDRVSPWHGEVMAVNDIGAHYPMPLRHWVTLHHEYMRGWAEYRLGHCYGNGVVATSHGMRAADCIDVVWPLGTYGDCSGLFACYVGLMLGYAPIVLAGVPATADGHFFDPPWVTSSNFDARLTYQQWAWARDQVFAGRVSSLSGNTCDWLGEP